jgi:hypothetical protein
MAAGRGDAGPERGSEVGSGNEAHRSPGESGNAEGANVPVQPYVDYQPDVPRPYPHPSSPDEEAAGNTRDKVRRIGGGGPA